MRADQALLIPKRGGTVKEPFALPNQRDDESNHGLDCIIAPQAIESTRAALRQLRLAH